MKQLFSKRSLAAIAASVALSATATDYYVNADPNVGSDENVGTSEGSAFATIDCAVTNATESTDIIHVAAGTYTTTTQLGPNLKAILIGEGSSRDDVVIQSSGTYRTLRMAAGSWVENVTIKGEENYKADKGGAIEISGGTLTNCVVTGGTASNKGGNLWMGKNGVLVVDCEISGGTASQNGGNICFDGGSLVDCVVSNGTANGTGNDKGGGNIHVSANDSWNGYGLGGTISRCKILNGSNDRCGGILSRNAATVIEDCLIASNTGGIMLEGAGQTVINTSIINNTKFGMNGYGQNSRNCTILNCVFFGNINNAEDANAAAYTGELPAVGAMSNCAFDTDKINNQDIETRYADSGCITSLSTVDFANYANSDYSPSQLSVLIDKGTPDPRGADASVMDLARNPRLSGTVDIGCYEYQKAELVVRIDDATPSPAYAPSVVTFKHIAENSETPVTFTYNYGDGSDEESTTDSTITHTYQNPGVYTVTITASNGQDDPAVMVYNNHVQIASSTVYVTPGNGAGTFPYDTAEKGYGNFKSAVQYAADGYTLLLGEGVHETVDQVSFNKALTIRGLGASPEAVIVRNTTATPNTYYHRTMEVNNANAWVENIAIENGCVRNQFGGNLRLVAGVVSNCVIRGGLAVADDGNAAGAAVELAGAATLTHCVISNNVVQGTSNDGSYAGGAIFVSYKAKNGRVSNCLIAHNRYVTSGDTVKAGTAGIRFGGSNDNTQIENNTIAANTVEGSLSDDSAGIHCTTWYGRLRNNIIVGNYETGKSKYTSVKMDKEHGTYVNCIDDPLAFSVFKNYANGDFRPSPNGAAYNRGTTAGLALLPAVDLGGGDRVKFSGKIDIGCYESQNRPGFVAVIR